MEKYLDTSLSPEERAEDLLGKMSLEEKMGQVAGWWPQKPGETEILRKNYPAGAGHISCIEMRDLKDWDEIARFQREIQETVMELSEHHIPAVFHMEGLCGAFLQDSTSFPSGIGRASSFDPALEERIGHVVAIQEQAAGVTQTFAPVLDISRDSRMGRQGETYGEDPALASAMGAAYTRGLQGASLDGRHTDAVAKHFLGFHESKGGIHGADAEISERELREVYARPFQAAVTESGLKGIMPCYCSLNGAPVSATEEYLTGLLREEMGFDGMTVADYCAISNVHTVQKVEETLADAGYRCMDAGLDVELPDKNAYGDELAERFADGSAAPEILDRAVRRVLTAKFRMGLFEHPFCLDPGEQQAVYEKLRPEAEQVSLESARESAVLLKNDGVLPAGPERYAGKKIAVIGWHAGTARSFFGGYTHFTFAEGKYAVITTTAGLGGERTENESTANVARIPGTKIQAESPVFEEILKHQKPEIRSLYEELRERFPDAQVGYAYGYPFAGNDTSRHAEALELAAGADLVIVTLGGKYGCNFIASMGEGVDSTNINLPECQEIFLKELEKLGKPVVGVHFNGRPVSSDTADRVCSALIEAWNPSEMGACALADVLTGKVSPSGKLPVSVAYNAGQIPVCYNHPNGSCWHQSESIGFPDYLDAPHRPRYPFGHGLSYTSFSYGNMEIRKEEGEGKIRISFELENTGDCYGVETAQMYVTDCYASMTRPVKELAGFRRVGLSPGEKKRVTFIMRADQMAFLDRKMRWKVEKGTFLAEIGSSSEDIRLSGEFRIGQDRYVDGRNRGFYAASEEEKI